jgi:uncharacterized peroxidase-related enzyme
VEAHAEDLRTVSGDDALTEAIKTDFRQAAMDEPTRKMLEYVERVTLTPADIEETEVEELKRHGFTDEDIFDIVHITGYFSHINRVADALGVDLEDFMIQGRTTH